MGEPVTGVRSAPSRRLQSAGKRFRMSSVLVWSWYFFIQNALCARATLFASGSDPDDARSFLHPSNRSVRHGACFRRRLSTRHARAAPASAVAELGVVRRSLASRVDRGRLNRYFFAMSTQQLTTEAMALPLSERVSLAQTLWQSIDAGLADTEEREAVREAIRRDQELSSGAVVGRTHEEVMQAARRAIGCA